MNGFYTCLMGNALTLVVSTQPLHVSVPLLLVISVVTIYAERHNVLRLMRRVERGQ